MTQVTLGATIAILVILGISIYWVLSVKHQNNKIREHYDKIRIGDRYVFPVGPLHPFDTVRYYYAKITDKTLYGGKHPWVQYRYDDGSVDQCELQEFLTFHKKVF